MENIIKNAMKLVYAYNEYQYREGDKIWMYICIQYRVPMVALRH